MLTIPQRDELRGLLSGSVTYSRTLLQELRGHLPRNKICIFLSSTSTDNKRERDVIMEKLVPEVQSAARKYGIEFMAVDLRCVSRIFFIYVRPCHVIKTFA